VAPAATRRNWKRKREDLAAERVREKRHQSPEGRWTFPARQRRDRMPQLPSPVEDLTAAVNAEKLNKHGQCGCGASCPCVAYFPISSREGGLPELTVGKFDRRQVSGIAVSTIIGNWPISV
jgi:hypothetical protein